MTVFTRTQELHWTAHARAKMRHYGLSEQRVRRVMHSPKRIEEGIAPKTVAYMQPSSVKTTDGKPDWKQEIWVMAQHVKSAPPPKRSGNANARPTEGHSGAALMRMHQKSKITKVISAWRYPGKTKAGEPLPADILRELRSLV